MDAHDQIAAQASREDNRPFQEVADDLKPHFSEREVLLLKLSEMAMDEFFKLLYGLPFDNDMAARATELMREIANVPDKQRLALMEIRDLTESGEEYSVRIRNIATNALK